MGSSLEPASAKIERYTGIGEIGAEYRELNSARFF